MIFSGAGEVVGLLGIEDKASQKAMRILTRMARTANTLHIRSPIDVELLPDREKSRLSSAVLQILGTDFDTWDSVLVSILEFLQKPYWKRLWIIQEVSLATSAVLLCGSDYVLWEEVPAALCFLRCIDHAVLNSTDNDRELTVLFRPTQPRRIRPPAAMALHANFNRSGRTGVPLGDCFRATCSRQTLHCVVPHDRIYALIGLMTQEDRQGNKVNYLSTYEELCIQTTVCLLEQYGPSLLT